MAALGARASKHSELLDSASSDDDGDGSPAFHVNEEYARRFEHNKKRTELHRLQAKHPELAARIEREQGREAAGARERGAESASGSSSSESEDEGEISPSADQEWMSALLKIRRRDPSIYDASTQLFPSEPDAASSHAKSSPDKPKHKSKTLREILYDQAVDEHADVGEEDTELDRKRRLREDRAASLAYDAEQQELRTSLLSKVHGGAEERAAAGASDDSDEEGGLTIKSRAAAAEPASTSGRGDFQAELQELFRADKSAPGGSRGAAFLQTFLSKRLWAEEGDDAGDSAGLLQQDGDAPLADGAADSDEDDAFLDRADDFERSYNFRSDEPGGASISTYPREIEGLARKQESKRKRQREARKERATAAERDRTAELKRLKNLKVSEMKQTYETLARVSGVAKAPSRKALKQLMDGDFDPEQWDRYMQETFDDDYYAAPESEVAVREDEVGLAKEMSSWGDDGPGAATDTFAALHARVTGSAAVDLPETDYALGGSAAADRPAEGPESSGDEEEDEDAGGEESASSDGEGGGVSDGEGGDLSAEEQAVHKEKIAKLLQEYYDLDHEDDVGGLKTRFRYRSVAPINDGLDPAEILALSDKDLNAVVGLRKLAPYHDATERIRPNYKALGEARQKLRDAGLYVDKRAKVAKARKPPSQASGRAEGGEKRKGSVGGTRRVAAAAAPAAEAGKRKRPGPALRRALKAQAAAHPGGDGGAAEEDVAAAAAPLVARKRKAQPEPTVEDRKRQRLASFGKLELPGKSARGGAGDGGNVRGSAGRKGRAGTQRSEQATDGAAASLPKAARKNARRAQKRHQLRAQRDSAGS